MDIRSLKYFYAVAKSRQFTQAAKELHISQPSLSNTIKALEQEIGCQLFERSTKRLTLTEPGQILYKHADHMLTQFEKIFKEMNDVKNVGNGKMSIGMIESYRYFIAHMISLFKKEYPNVSMKVRELGPKDIEQYLKNYDIHLGITSIANHENGFEYIPIFQEEYVLITPLNHHFKNNSNINIIDLYEETFIHSLEGFEIRETFIKACQDAGFTPTIEFETQSLETARSLVENGLGISIIPERFLALNPSTKVNVVYIKNFLPKRTVYMVYQPDRYLSPAIHDFIKITSQFSKEVIEYQ
ncbi:LysR family transcriptional regulator [Sporosarcina sp. HYO08]|uniref:LysR family transcriptional regulator n=1 Tax=Sporosarcina sp. HYO08 TaxID=1759557 RepID=UPI00079A1DA1|nr:LysR family transcriptional regulator [Sporosarcina sp. HYO08]KXH87027.1 hypothetical protein AU377_00135 [Sporosarcina sp. HYO08]